MLHELHDIDHPFLFNLMIFFFPFACFFDKFHRTKNPIVIQNPIAMKRTAALMTICLMLGGFVAFSQTSQSKDIEAIKSVVARETESFMNVDRKTWSESWLQSPYSYWSYSDSTNSNFVDGWENINKTFDEYFKTQKPSRSKITNFWQEVRIYGNGAYVRFTQRVEDEIDKDETSQVRVLEKKDGKWKVVCMNAIAKYPAK
jgi:Calcium/calmodulin dependent protein kinase II association domain